MVGGDKFFNKKFPEWEIESGVLRKVGKCCNLQFNEYEGVPSSTKRYTCGEVASIEL